MSELRDPTSSSVPNAVTALAPGMIAPEPGAPAPLTTIQLALYAGWTMAVLYGNLPDQPTEIPELRTVNELQPPQRRELELARLRYLLKQLARVPAIAQADLTPKIPASADSVEFNGEIADLHLTVLKALTAGPPDPLLAYQLGRSLRDTVNPPVARAPAATAPTSALAQQLRRDRIAKLQEWLATLAQGLPPHAAPVVATSLGRWSEFAAVTLGTNSKLMSGDQTGIETEMRKYLLPQGDTWLMLLTGARPTAGLLSPEAYVAAAEDALRRSARSVRQVLQHYWLAVVIAAAALGGVLYLVISNLGGAAKVWTSIAAVGTSLGISANSIMSTTRRLAAEAEQPVFAMAEEDAMAWAVTTLPPAVNLSYRGARQLRKAGVAPPGSLGRG
jgi:hypothetical protein